MSMNRQKNSLCFACFVLSLLLMLSFTGLPLFAQGNIRIVHDTVQEYRGDAPYLGRDVWFCIPQNSSDGDNSQKYFNVYVTSPRKTTVHFQRQGYPRVD